MDFDKILNLYKEGIITKIEAINSLQNLFNSANIESTNIPEGMIYFAKRYDLGLSSKSFSETKWNRFINSIIEYKSLNLEKDPFENTEKYFHEVLRVEIEKDTKYKIKRDIKVTVIPCFKAPFSDTLHVTLKKNCEIITTRDTFSGEIDVVSIPTDYKKIQNEIMPEEYLKDKYYSGFFIKFNINDLNENCEKL